MRRPTLGDRGPRDAMQRALARAGGAHGKRFPWLRYLWTCLDETSPYSTEQADVTHDRGPGSLDKGKLVGPCRAPRSGERPKGTTQRYEPRRGGRRRRCRGRSGGPSAAPPGEQMPIPLVEPRCCRRPMTDYQFALLMGFGVKALTMASGVVGLVLGYKLFTRGVYRGGAGVRVEGWKAVLAMDKGGPGLVFALFGAAVLVVGVIREVTVRHDRSGGDELSNPTVVPRPIPSPTQLNAPASSTPVSIPAAQGEIALGGGDPLLRPAAAASASVAENAAPPRLVAPVTGARPGTGPSSKKPAHVREEASLLINEL
jgi:hypothetical protein